MFCVKSFIFFVFFVEKSVFGVLIVKNVLEWNEYMFVKRLNLYMDRNLFIIL